MLAIWRVLLGLAARRMAGKLIAAAEAEAFSESRVVLDS